MIRERRSYRTAEIARELAVTPRTVRRLIERGDLAGGYVGRVLRVDRDAYTEYRRKVLRVSTVVE